MSRFNVTVQLTGEDGNAFAILDKVSRALLDAGVSEGQVKVFRSEATDGDYSHLLAVCMEWVDVR